MIRDKRLGYALLTYALGLLLLALPRCAKAEAVVPPCRQVGSEVVCQAADFDRLVTMIMDARRDAATCAARLQHCEGKPESVCLPPPLVPSLPPGAVTSEPSSLVKPISSVALAVMSGAAVVAGVVLDAQVTDRATLIGGGLLGIGLAALLAVR